MSFELFQWESNKFNIQRSDKSFGFKKNFDNNFLILFLHGFLRLIKSCATHHV